MEGTTEEDEVRIRIGKKIVKILRGKEAKATLKAIELVLDTVKSHKKIRVDIIDVGMPKNFKYSKAILEAIDEYNLENPIEIAEYVLQKLKETNRTIS